MPVLLILQWKQTLLLRRQHHCQLSRMMLPTLLCFFIYFPMVVALTIIILKKLKKGRKKLEVKAWVAEWGQKAMRAGTVIHWLNIIFSFLQQLAYCFRDEVPWGPITKNGNGQGIFASLGLDIDLGYRIIFWMIFSVYFIFLVVLLILRWIKFKKIGAKTFMKNKKTKQRIVNLSRFWSRFVKAGLLDAALITACSIWFGSFACSVGRLCYVVNQSCESLLLFF